MIESKLEYIKRGWAPPVCAVLVAQRSGSQEIASRRDSYLRAVHLVSRGKMAPL